MRWLEQRRLKSDDPATRLQAIRALAKSPHAGSVRPLLQLLLDPDHNVRFEAYDALVRFGNIAVPALKKALESPDVIVRAAACSALGEIPAPDHPACLMPRLEDDEPNVRLAAVEALGRLKAVDAMPQILAMASLDTDSDVRAAACTALGALGHADAAPTLLTNLQDDAEKVQRSAAAALHALDYSCTEATARALTLIAIEEWLATYQHRQTLSEWDTEFARISSKNWADLQSIPIDSPRLADAVQRFLQGHRSEGRIWAAQSLARIGGSDAIAPLLSTVLDADIDVSRAAADAAAQIGRRAGVGLLLATLNCKDPALQVAAASVLGQVGDERACSTLLRIIETTQNDDLRAAAIEAMQRIAQAVQERRAEQARANPAQHLRMVALRAFAADADNLSEQARQQAKKELDSQQAGSSEIGFFSSGMQAVDPKAYFS